MTVYLDSQVAAMSREQANAVFRASAEELVRDEGLDLTQAWAKARALFPNLYDRAFTIGEPDTTEPQVVGRFSDSSSLLGGSRVAANPYATGGPGHARLMVKQQISLPNTGNIEALGLPADASFEEFRAADLANAGASPRDSFAIFTALVGLLAGRGIAPGQARSDTEKRFPQLAQEAAAALAQATEARPPSSGATQVIDNSRSAAESDGAIILNGPTCPAMCLDRSRRPTNL